MTRRASPYALSWFLAAGVCSLGVAQDVSLQASVDRATIRENESFTYVLRATGQVRGEPDLTPLSGSFDILQRSRNTNIQMAGGRTTQITEWILQLMPRAPGRFSLPPVELAGSFTNPLEIEVLPATAGDAPGEIFLEVDASPSNPYVQSQVIFTLRLHRGVGTGPSTLTPPEVSGGEAIIERLGEDREYQTVLQDRNFNVLERRYAIFPQAAGPLIIEPVTFEAVVITPSGFSSLQRFRAEPLELMVRPPVPPPPSYPDAAWLPAHSLSLSERWSAGLGELTAGIPQTRTLLLEAEGVLETQLPELRLPQTEGIRQYSDQPELVHDAAESGIAARRIERFAVIAQSGGQRFIPGIELPWFNVTQQRWEVATLPTRPVRVIGSPEQTAGLPPTAPAVAEPPPLTASADPLWQAVTAGLLLAWLATLGLWWRDRHPAAGEPSAAPPARRSTNRRLLRELRAACRENDSARARALLLEWGALRLPQAEARSLGALADALPEDLAGVVRELERSLYGPAPVGWDGARLHRALRRVDSLSQPPDEDRRPELLPLYR